MVLLMCEQHVLTTSLRHVKNYKDVRKTLLLKDTKKRQSTTLDTVCVQSRIKLSY